MCAVKLRINNSIFMIQGLCIILMLWLSLSEGFHYSSILYQPDPYPESIHTAFMKIAHRLSLIVLSNCQSVIVPSLGIQSHLSDSIFISSWPGSRHQAHDMDPAFSLSPAWALRGHHCHHTPAPDTRSRSEQETYSELCDEHQFVHKGVANIALHSSFIIWTFKLMTKYL